MQLSLPSILCVTYAFYAKMKRKTSKTSEDKNKDENKDEDENENKDETKDINKQKQPKQPKVYPMSRTN